MFAERIQDADEYSRRRDTARGCGNFADVELFAEDGEECERVRAGTRFATRTGFHCVRFCVSYEQGEEESRTVSWSSWKISRNCLVDLYIPVRITGGWVVLEESFLLLRSKWMRRTKGMFISRAGDSTLSLMLPKLIR